MNINNFESNYKTVSNDVKKILDYINNRLNQAFKLLNKLSTTVNQLLITTGKFKKINYTVLQNQLQVLITQLNSVTVLLSNNKEILKGINVFPKSNLLLDQYEEVVSTLLRKKPDLKLIEWQKRGFKLYENKSDEFINQESEFSEWCYEKFCDIKENYQFYGLNYGWENEHDTNTSFKKTKTSEKNKIISKENRIQALNQVLHFMNQGVIS